MECSRRARCPDVSGEQACNKKNCIKERNSDEQLEIVETDSHEERESHETHLCFSESMG